MEKEQHNIIIYSSPDGKINVSLMTRDGKIWLNQSQISDLFGTSVQNISYHIIDILKDKELDKIQLSRIIRHLPPMARNKEKICQDAI